MRSWLGKAGGTVQFLTADDSFVFTRVVCEKDEKEGKEKKEATCTCASQLADQWTAARRGAARRPTGGQGDGKKSLLQRWGWYILAGFGYYSYKAVKEAAAGGAKSD